MVRVSCLAVAQWLLSSRSVFSGHSVLSSCSAVTQHLGVLSGSSVVAQRSLSDRSPLSGCPVLSGCQALNGRSVVAVAYRSLSAQQSLRGPSAVPQWSFSSPSVAQRSLTSNLVLSLAFAQWSLNAQGCSAVSLWLLKGPSAVAQQWLTT